MTDDRARANWRLLRGERELMSVPRVGFVRSIMLNMYHTADSCRCICGFSMSAAGDLWRARMKSVWMKNKASHFVPEGRVVPAVARFLDE